MEIIHLLTDLNPIQVIVDAVVNSGPREDVTRMGSAGVVRREAVDISLLRRVYQAIYVLTTGARGSSFRKVKTIAECLTMYTRDLPTVMPLRRVGLSVLPRLTDKDICFGQQFRCKLLGILYMFGCIYCVCFDRKLVYMARTPGFRVNTRGSFLSFFCIGLTRSLSVNCGSFRTSGNWGHISLV